MNKIDVIPVVLCGGSGTRLWPLSRSGFPKQFLVLDGYRSLFQAAIERLMNIESDDICVKQSIVVTGEEHRFLVAEQLSEISINPKEIILEPFGKNTAPALTLAALSALSQDENAVLVVTPSDQAINNEICYRKAIQNAVLEASTGKIVILGIKAVKPETGYGYIKISSIESCGPMEVESFVEKPDEVAAKKYVENGQYYWNSGIFILKASLWLSALKFFDESTYWAVEKSWNRKSTDSNFNFNFVRPGKPEFSKVDNESVDYAVIEKCPGSIFPIVMMPLDAGWSDLGTWNSVWQSLDKDKDGNSFNGDVVSIDTEDSIVHASNRLVGLIGLKNIVVVETADAILIADKDSSQKVKDIVQELVVRERLEHVSHRKVYRPWGWYDSIEEDTRFKVKRIMVKPGASLSLQKHHHRAEHWIVVKGTAEVTIAGEMSLLTENQSVYIPLGEVHRLRNPGIIDLEIIEVQSGSYLGEEDIVRLDDNYGR